MIKLLRLPVHRVRASDLKKYQHIALVDTQPAFRNNPFPPERRATIVIDQHGSRIEPNADCFIYDPGCGATCVILTQALITAGIAIPQRIATALAYGIVSDTLNFFRSQRTDVIQAYIDLLPYCDMKALARIQNPDLSQHFFVIMARGINCARVCRQLIVSHLGIVEDPDAVSQVADMLLAYQGMRWALCTGRYKGSLRVSLRVAEKKLAASDTLQDVMTGRGQAGGHDTIAGGSIEIGIKASERAWHDEETALIGRLKRRLGIPLKTPFGSPFSKEVH